MIQGLSNFALAFMLVSMGTVTALMVYCFWRILRDDRVETGPAAAGRPEPGESGDGRTD